MKQNNIIWTTLFSLLLSWSLSAQKAPLQEMRGAWVATVNNIDWPTTPNRSPEQQRKEFLQLLDDLKAMGFNAVFVQIRPAGDAFYPSKLAPWSKFLSGQQGLAPSPYYDPLEFMIKAAHERRMEFHAWLNPYRATTDLDTAALASSHPLRSLGPERKQQWFFQYGSRYYFNPANPLVVRYIDQIVKEIVSTYDVDGIHFDDYFYPYPEQGEVLPDQTFFANNPKGFTSIHDWRRDHINSLIQTVSQTIRSTKPWVRFGISPFGVWRNASKDPKGSATNASFSSYDDLYADVLLWLQKNWIDYVAPQLYWSIGFPAADYHALTDWWSKNTFGKQLYIGHGAHKIGNGSQYKDANWNKKEQTNRQIAINRQTPGVHGSIFFSIKALRQNTLGVRDSLQRTLFNTPALVPSPITYNNITPVTPQFCRVDTQRDSVRFSWSACEVLTPEEMPYYFGIYRFKGEKTGDFKNPENLLALTPYAFPEENWKWSDHQLKEGEPYTYALVAYNRYHQASIASEPIFIKKTDKGVRKKRPIWGYRFRG